MRLSSSIRRSLVPEMPISTYSPATVQPRRSAYSRSSRVSIVGVLPVVGGAHLRVDCDSHLSLQVACCIAGLCSGPGPSGAPFCHSSYRAPVIPRTACHSNSTIPGSDLSDRRFRFLSEGTLAMLQPDAARWDPTDQPWPPLAFSPLFFLENTSASTPQITKTPTSGISTTKSSRIAA